MINYKIEGSFLSEDKYRSMQPYSIHSCADLILSYSFFFKGGGGGGGGAQWLSGSLIGITALCP